MSSSSSEDESKKIDEKNGFVFFGVGKDLDVWYNEAITLLETEKMIKKADILIAAYLKTKKNNCVMVLSGNISNACGWHTTISLGMIYFGGCTWIIDYIYKYDFLYAEPTDLDLMREEYDVYGDAEIWSEEGMHISSCY